MTNPFVIKVVKDVVSFDCRTYEPEHNYEIIENVVVDTREEAKKEIRSLARKHQLKKFNGMFRNLQTATEIHTNF